MPGLNVSRRDRDTLQDAVNSIEQAPTVARPYGLRPSGLRDLESRIERGKRLHIDLRNPVSSDIKASHRPSSDSRAPTSLNADPTMSRSLPEPPSGSSGSSQMSLFAPRSASRRAATGLRACTPSRAPGRDPRRSRRDAGRALFSRLRDPDGMQIEIMEFGADSQQRRAMNAWKD